MRQVSEFIRRLWLHRALLGELVRRELTESYAGSVLAGLWAVLHPLTLFGVYLFVFGYVFSARIGLPPNSSVDFAGFMLTGLSGWLGIQGALSLGTAAIVRSAALVKQVVFPIDLLPVRAVIAGMFPLVVGVVLVILYTAIRFGEISPLVWLLPFVVIWEGVLLVGIALVLSSVTVFVRDTRDGVQFFTSFGLFLLPVIYPPGRLPEWFITALHFNPFSYFIWVMQDILYYQEITRIWIWVVFAVLPVLALVLGVRFFNRTREHFGDAL